MLEAKMERMDGQVPRRDNAELCSEALEVVVQLWDISGAKAHVGTRSAFYRDFDAVMCVRRRERGQLAAES